MHISAILCYCEPARVRLLDSRGALMRAAEARQACEPSYARARLRVCKLRGVIFRDSTGMGNFVVLRINMLIACTSKSVPCSRVERTPRENGSWQFSHKRQPHPSFSNQLHPTTPSAGRTIACHLPRNQEDGGEKQGLCLSLVFASNTGVFQRSPSKPFAPNPRFSANESAGVCVRRHVVQ